MQFLGKIGDFVDRMAKREVSLGLNSSLGQPVDALLKNLPGGLFEAGHRPRR